MSTPPPRRRGTLARPDCTLAYEITGAAEAGGGRPAMVFAHGLGGNHMSWFQQVAHFAPRHVCVAFAHRGFHPSSPLPDGPDPADYADDLAALIGHLGLGDVVIVAQSMGGWSAVEYALRRPAGLKGVLLAATTGTIDPRRAPAAFQPRLAAWEQESARALAEFAAAGIHPAAGARMAAEQPAMHLLYRHIDDQNASLDKQALRGRLMRGRVRAPEELAGAACKVLLIANDEDMVIPPVGMEAVAAACPNARLARIPEAGHSGYFERPALFNRLVEEFLAELG